MRLDEYQTLAKRTFNTDVATLDNAVLGIAGEAGEIADYLKKIKFQGHKYNAEIMKEELGDLLFYVANAARLCGYTLQEVAEHNNNKLLKRYPNGFEERRSVNREV